MPVPISNIGSGPYGTAAKSDDANRKIDAEQIESIFQEMSKSQENVAASASSSRRPSWFSRQYVFSRHPGGILDTNGAQTQQNEHSPRQQVPLPQ
ncbi:hypothetical protein N7468_010427 [Penicillium chermesinum]|uniref:Uncharacterized protein n=1 Tax=Penicillium chermesinum TaxID=63820 RepID=A0A9W9NEF4_9EURO|nr:uncharacterized protein N7468_010427 [Penicillium chermesinum]KAJ5217419.1 hypothetical protein N7468_010427 [Penicillium chermesinum]